jgi:4-hydroxy-tetrahydrodipicolinate reductase
MRLAVMGANGRMGRALTLAVNNNSNAVIGGAVEQSSSEAVGVDIGTLNNLNPIGIPVTDDPVELFTKIDGILDFTSPAATLKFAELSAQARIVHVIGTTGFTAEDEEKLEAASRHATIIKAGNMSLGVNLLVALTRKVASLLDESFDIEILEMHHRHKVDAPSGTSLMLGKAAAEGRAVNIDERSVRTRDGQTGPRKDGDIGFANLRGGSVTGDHTVIFAGDGERIELTHKADDRSIFANGAVKAALWGQGKAPGLYSMADVLGLE